MAKDPGNPLGTTPLTMTLEECKSACDEHDKNSLSKGCQSFAFCENKGCLMSDKTLDEKTPLDSDAKAQAPQCFSYYRSCNGNFRWWCIL